VSTTVTSVPDIPALVTLL